MSDHIEDPVNTEASNPEAENQDEVTLPAVVVPASSTEDPADYGRVDEEGNVWVKEAAGERQVGSYPDAVPEDPLALYTRRFLDLEAKVNLFEMRLPTLNGKEIEQTLKSLDEELKEPAAVGNLDGLRDRVKELHSAGEARKEEAVRERAAAKKQAYADREAVVEEAEAIANQDPERTQWKNSGQRLRDLLEEWKNLQRHGPRLDRADEDALWKRFSSSRTKFDRHRRHFFSALDARQADAKRIKEGLIEEAIEMQNSTDWGRTSAAYRDLMDRWKKAGRASRKDDDALWKRFRAAQQVFFDARRENSEAIDSEYRENLKVKEALLEEAEALLPIEDLEATTTKLRDIQDRWEEAGRVPRNDVGRVEGRMRAVEKAVRDAEEEQWRRSDPRTKARAEGMMGQLEDSIAELERDLASAEEANDEKKAKSIREALETKRAWYNQISGSVDN
ncbi:MAG TPA: DUF349 domain-containing protein [Actinomyces sp.]|nr:DUF349 domain-containing protein [Acidobacteriota bacterium]HHT41388.1 DUF349 domain-containing protein [Actinomyces sp.]